MVTPLQMGSLSKHRHKIRYPYLGLGGIGLTVGSCICCIYLFIEEVDTTLYIPWTSTVGFMFIRPTIVRASYGGESILNPNSHFIHVILFIKPSFSCNVCCNVMDPESANKVIYSFILPAGTHQNVIIVKRKKEKKNTNRSD